MLLNAEIAVIGGKGRAVIATSDIPCGATILDSEAPILMLPSSTNESDLCDAIDNNDILSATLDAPAAPAVLQRNSRPSLRRLYTNAFLHVSPSSSIEYIALYQNISMVNHSCAPNAILRSTFSVKDGVEAANSSLIAVSDIVKGDEVCIAYQLLMAPRGVRRLFFEQHYGFTCQCVRCSAQSDSNDVDVISIQCPGVFVDGNFEAGASPGVRRLEKVFQFSLDPISSQTTLRVSDLRLDALRNMLRLSLADDSWRVFEPSGSTYWKAAILRESILINAESVVDGLSVELSTSVMQRIRVAQRWFVVWFFAKWVSPLHLSHLIEAIS